MTLMLEFRNSISLKESQSPSLYRPQEGGGGKEIVKL